MSDNTAPSTSQEPSQTNTAPLEGQEAPDTQVQEAEKPAPRKFKVKVDGQESEVDEETLVRDYQISKASYKKMEEARALKTQLEGFMESFETDPVGTLKKLSQQKGKDGKAFRELVEQYLYSELTMEQMDPRERQLLEQSNRIKQMEEAERTREESAKAEQLKAMQEHYAVEYDREISTALQGAGLPKTAGVVKRTAELMSKSLEHGLDLPAAQIVKMVREEYLAAQKELVGSMDPEALYNYFGEDVAKKIRQVEVARLKGPQAPRQGQKPVEANSGPAPTKKVTSERDWDAMMKSVT